MEKRLQPGLALLLSISFATPMLASPAAEHIEFVHIPAGTFTMGTTNLDDIHFEMPPDSTLLVTDEQPAHRVSLSGFMLGKYEITQSQWYSVMQSKPGPDEYWQDPHWQQLPVVSVSWIDTQDFIQRLNRRDEHFHYRLPTEAEWEYAARGGTASLRPFEREQLDEHAWLLSNSEDRPHPVGQKRANPYGLYDMFGNAWEWVNDWYQANAYQHMNRKNPTGPQRGQLKVRRGGSYHCAPHLVRSGYRAADDPSQRYSVLGFRLVREAKQ